MDFKKLVLALAETFEKERIPYALVGAVALALYGIPRGTNDIDFLIRKEDAEQVRTLLERLGYSVIENQESFTQMAPPLSTMGYIDLLKASRDVTLAMLSRVISVPFVDGPSVNVVRPEDYIGLKLIAIKNNPERRPQDQADIQEVLLSRGDTLDWTILEKYCAILKMEELWDEIKRNTGR